MSTEKNQPPALMRSGDSKYTWEDAIAAIGQDFSSGEQHVADEVITQTSVARFCEPWEIGNPLYWDEKAAKQAGYKNVVVPWSAIKQTFSYSGNWRPGEPTRFPVDMGKDVMSRMARMSPTAKPLPAPPTSQSVFTDMEIEFFEPVCVGDRISVKGNKLVNVRPRKTRIGDGAFVNHENEFYNQRGELVARAIQGSYSYNP